MLLEKPHELNNYKNFDQKREFERKKGKRKAVLFNRNIKKNIYLMQIILGVC
jgi:hypothetical protein